MSPPDATAQENAQSYLDAAGYGRPTRGYAALRRVWRLVTSSPALQALLALVVYAALWLPTIASPLVSHPSRAQLFQNSPDPNFYVWSLRWWPYAVGHGYNPLYTTLINAPVGHSLAWVTTVPPLALLATPLTLAAGPVAAFNLLTALAPPLTSWAAFLPCRRLTGQFWPGLVGGAVYGFSSYELNHFAAGQLNMCYALLPPLLAYLVVAWRDGGLKSYALVILASLVLAVQFYLFLETFADLTAILVLSLLLGLAVAGKASRGKVLRLAGLLAIAYVIALALAFPYLADALRTAPPKPPGFDSMDLASLWLPRAGRSLGLGWLAREEVGPGELSDGCRVGIPLLALAVALAVRFRRSRLVWFLTGMLVLIIIGSLGPQLNIGGTPEFMLPWHALFSLPFVRNSYPTRLMLFAFLALALSTSLWLARSAQAASPRGWRAVWPAAGRWSLGVLVVASLVLNASVPISLRTQTTIPEFIRDGFYQQYLTPGEVVMVASTTGNAGMAWQADSGDSWRLIGGYINAGFDHRTGLPVQVQKLEWPTPARIDRLENFIRADHVGAILVDVGHKPPWARLLRIFGLKGRHVAGVIVYPTLGCRACHGVTRAEIEAATFPS